MYSLAVENDNERAMHQLGKIYIYNEMYRDISKGIKLLKQAAENDYSPAQFELAMCFYSGIGVHKDKGEALQWLQRADDLQDEQAHDFLQKHLRFGRLMGFYKSHN